MASSRLLALASGLQLAVAAAAAAGAAGTPSASAAVALDERTCGGGCHGSLLQVQARPVGKPSPAGPSIFVYELPPTAKARGEEETLRTPDPCEALPAGSDSQFECIFGRSLDWALPSPGGPPLLLPGRDVSQYALGNIYLASLLQHPRRTLNPDEADLFFVTANANNTEESDCPGVETLVGQLPYLTAATAKRHFWVNPRVAWRPLSCDAFNAQLEDPAPAARLLARTTKLALEDRESAPLGPEHMSKVQVQAGIRVPPSAENLHSIPYPSILSGLGSEDLGRWQDALAQRRQRPNLASASWGMHGSDLWGMRSTDMRAKLRSECEGSSRCSFLDLDDNRYGTNNAAVVAEMLNATFCLQVTGDTPSRKGIVDSIVAGCIPVLFSSLQTKLWPWHVGNWEDVSLLLEWPHADTLQYLADVPAAEVERLQRNLAELAPRLSYSPPGQPRAGDALDLSLRAIWRLAR